MDSAGMIASTLCLIIPVVTVGYAMTCAAWPFGNCRRCDGTGKRRSPTGRHFRDCRRCEGTGKRVRVGRRVYEYIRAEHAKGTTGDRDRKAPR